MRDEHNLWTWTAQKDFVPFPLGGGEGAWFRDRAGTRYLDLASVVLNANAGHNHPRIIAAMRRQLDEFAVAGPFMSTPIREAVARELSGVTPGGLDWFLFTLGGADANEHAVKLAILATGRKRVVCRSNSYHGATFGALSFSDDPRAAPFARDTGGVVRVRDPYCHRCPWDTRPDICDRPCVSHVEETILREDPESIAAVLMETVPGTTAGYFPPADYYRRLRAICDRHGILLILDEVLTGFGRTGRWFAAGHYGITPDMITMGKGITSGHAPLGAVAVSTRIARRFADRPLLTGLTHTAHPLSLAAAAGNLEAFQEEGLVERSRVLGEILAERLRVSGMQNGFVRDARSLGLYGCLEMADGVDLAMLKREAFERQVHLLVRGRCLFVAPPLVIEEDDLHRGLDVVDEALGLV